MSSGEAKQLHPQFFALVYDLELQFVGVEKSGSPSGSSGASGVQVDLVVLRPLPLMME
jgi:hypothetical protein